MSTGRIARVVRRPAADELEPLFSLTRLSRRAEQEAERLRAQATETLACARREADAMLDKAREDSAAVAARATGEAVTRINALLAAIEQAESTHRQEREAASIALAVRIAGAILRAELTADPGRVIELAAHTLAHARREAAVAVEMHPEDAAFIRDALGHVVAAAGFHGTVRVIDRASLARGSVRLHAVDGVRDGSLETRLAELERKLLEGRPGDPKA
jgi:flagellar biosynthesis/type III secretory pathway protein FliH